MNPPTETEIKNLHKKYAVNDDVYNLIYTHSLIVCEIALSIVDTKKIDADRELVKVGAMLHDIGVYKLYDANGQETDEPYLRHGIRGYEVLKAEGYDEIICRFASHHTGVGLTKKEIIANKLPLPEEDLLADSPEELIVMYADKFHSKTTPPFFNTAEWYADHVVRFGRDKKTRFEGLVERFGAPDLEGLSKKYGHVVRDL